MPELQPVMTTDELQRSLEQERAARTDLETKLLQLMAQVASMSASSSSSSSSVAATSASPSSATTTTALSTIAATAVSAPTSSSVSTASHHRIRPDRVQGLFDLNVKSKFSGVRTDFKSYSDSVLMFVGGQRLSDHLSQDQRTAIYGETQLVAQGEDEYWAAVDAALRLALVQSISVGGLVTLFATSPAFDSCHKVWSYLKTNFGESRYSDALALQDKMRKEFVIIGDEENFATKIYGLYETFEKWKAAAVATSAGKKEFMFHLMEVTNKLWRLGTKR